MHPLKKWLAYYRPMLRGRFATCAVDGRFRFEQINRGTALFGGRFWQRERGGYHLYQRDPVARTPWLFVGRADGAAITINTLPMYAPEPDRATQYRVTVVGAGGVESEDRAARWIVTLDQHGALVADAPNPPLELSVRVASADAFELTWFYDEDGQQGKPVAFDIFNDVGSPGAINANTVVASTPYRLRKGHFSIVVDGFDPDLRVGWQVRARNANDAYSGPSTTRFATINLGTSGAATPLALP